MAPKTRKRGRQACPESVSRKATRKSVSDTAGEVVRLARGKNTSRVTSKSLKSPGQNLDRVEKAIERCEAFIHRLSKELETLKSYIDTRDPERNVLKEKKAQAKAKAKPKQKLTHSVLSSGDWLVVTPCCEADEALDGMTFIEAWKNYIWPGTPPTVLSVRYFGKGLVVLVETPEDMEKSLYFSAPTGVTSGKNQHFMTISKFNPGVYTIKDRAGISDRRIVAAVRASFPHDNFGLYRMGKKVQDMSRKCFLVFGSVPVQMVDAIYYEGYIDTDGNTLHSDLAAEDVCFACKKVVEHTYSNPCKKWRHVYSVCDEEP